MNNTGYGFMKYLILICMIATTTFNLELSAVLCGNGAGLGYCDINPKPGCPTGRLAAGGQNIESMIEEAAAHFSTAFSEFLKITARIEASGLDNLDYRELAAISGKSAWEMEYCGQIYKNLAEAASQTPYNRSFILRLKTFDYDGFARGRGLNLPLFNKVKGYLAKGDLTGFLTFTAFKAALLAGQTAKADQKIAQEGVVSLESIWQANEGYSEFLLMGQYAARIFRAL